MTSKVMVSLPPEFLSEVDRIAREEHRSRSELFREAMRLYIRHRQKAKRPGDDTLVQSAMETQNRLSRLAPGVGEDSADDVWYSGRGTQPDPK